MKSVIFQCLQKVKWTSESKVIDIQTLNFFPKIGNWRTNDIKFSGLPLTSSLLPKHTQFLLSPLSPPLPTNLQLTARLTSSTRRQSLHSELWICEENVNASAAASARSPQRVTRRRRWRTTH